MTQGKEIGQQFGEVRHQIDIDALNAYLKREVSAIATPVTVKQFSYGQSNPTYILFGADSKRYVLRKKPPGGLMSSTAHAIEREYRILSALHKFNESLPSDGSRDQDRVPVPQVFCLCEDSKIVGTNFYIMAFVTGRIFEDYRLLELSSKEERKQCWISALTTLAALHRIKPESVGLADYGGAKAFYTRQMKSLGKVSHVQSGVKDRETGEVVGPIPGIDDFLTWFGRNMPADENVLVHGDYKIDNLIFHPTEPRVIGLLDWELSTRGHPLSDLANLLQPFSLPCEQPARINDPALWKDSRSQGSLLLTLGGLTPDQSPVPTEAFLLETYCKHASRPYPIPQWTAAKAWAWFRLAVIAQGIAARNAQGQASSAQAKVYGSKFPVCAKAMFTVIHLDQQTHEKAKL